MKSMEKSMTNTIWAICIGVGMVIIASVAFSLVRQVPIAGSMLTALSIIGLAMIALPLLGGILAARMKPEAVNSEGGKDAELIAGSEKLFAPPLTETNFAEKQKYKKEHLSH